MKFILAIVLLGLPLTATAKVTPESEEASDTAAIHSSIYSQVQSPRPGFDGICALRLEPEAPSAGGLAPAAYEEEKPARSIGTCTAG